MWACATAGCGPRDFENPLDSRSPGYVGGELAGDDDGDGIANGLDPAMVRVPGGCYRRPLTTADSTGSSGATASSDTSAPAPPSAVEVCVSTFSLAETEVTQGEYSSLMATDEAPVPAAIREPAAGITWFEAVEYCNALSRTHGLSPAYVIGKFTVSWDTAANGFRLPTEAEWEWAFGAADSAVWMAPAGTRAWYRDNSGSRPHPVAQKEPSPNGFYDLAGNVGEWVWDWEQAAGPMGNNPRGPEFGTLKLVKGGGYVDSLPSLFPLARTGWSRHVQKPWIGFRLARSR